MTPESLASSRSIALSVSLVGAIGLGCGRAGERGTPPPASPPAAPAPPVAPADTAPVALELPSWTAAPVQHPNLVVVDIDSLRADVLDRAYDDQPVAPTLRALAARGTTFDHAYAQSGWTVPGLTALLTGRWPVAVDVAAQATPLLPKAARLVPDVLGLYGYRSTVVWGTGVEADFPDLSRGFDTVLRRGVALGLSGDDLDVFAPWFAAPPPEPFLLFVHDFDAHVPGPWFTSRTMHTFGSDGLSCGDAGYRDALSLLRPTLGEAAATAHIRKHYDGAVHGYDALLARLLTRLRAAGLLDRTIVVVTSNHGEDIGEHGAGVKHGGLHDTTLRVPLVVAGPGVSAGARSDAAVQGIDLAPTLLALAGVPADRTQDGESLLPVLTGGALSGPNRPVFSLTDDHTVSVRTDRWKLIYTDAPRDDAPPPPPTPGPPPPGRPHTEPRHELYDLVADPGETRDVYGDRAGEVAELVAALARFRADRAAAASEATPSRVDPALRSSVQAHGYWDVAGGGANPPGPPAPSATRPDPPRP